MKRTRLTAVALIAAVLAGPASAESERLTQEQRQQIAERWSAKQAPDNTQPQ